MATRIITGAATDQKGQGTTSTVKVMNRVAENEKLRFKLTAASDYVPAEIVLFAGCARNGAALALNNKLTYSNPNGFASYADQVSYYQHIAVNFDGLMIQTDDTENYEDTFLIISEQSPSGKTTNISIDLSEFRSTTGGSTYSDKIILTTKDFDQIQWSAAELRLSKLKAGTSMTFTFPIQLWNKVQELNPVRVTEIG